MRNILKEKLARGEKPLGTFVGTGSAAVVECLGCAGLDFAILDNEHSPIEAETTARLVCAAERRNITPLARVLKDAYGLVERPCGAEPIQGCDVILYQTSRRLPPISSGSSTGSREKTGRSRRSPSRNSVRRELP
jgi:hpcH/hpaI aldolase/citrate lyase family protein